MTDADAVERLEAPEALLRAADVLLKSGVDLDPVQVLHAEIARALSASATPSVPAHYSSLSEALRQHDRLLSEWESQTKMQASPLRLFLRRQTPWFYRAVIAGLLLLLTLRYAWAVTYGKNWARQHPEGNWISRFYRTGTFEGYPLLRYDVGVNSDFGEGAPADSVKKDFFSARWDTCLLVTKDIVVALQLQSDDSSKLFVDDQLQFEVEPGPGQKSADVALHPGLRQLRVEFVERGGAAVVRLSGLESDGTDAYTFRRPIIEGEELRCH